MTVRQWGAMSQYSDARRPSVFISYATVDQSDARRLRQDLLDRGVDPFLDVVDIAPGADVVMGINDALERADFYLLLWSAAARDRYWVKSEISAALALERRLDRPFVFIVRLDESELPALLAPRRYLDLFGGGRDSAADMLATVWRRDRELGVGVRIAPHPVPRSLEPVVHVYARNRALAVAHEITVPLRASTRDVVATLGRQLALPSEASEYGGAVGVRFGYRYLLRERPLDPESGDTPALADGDVIDIEVTVVPFGPGGSLAEPVSFLPEREQAVSPTVVRTLSRKAFRHLVVDAEATAAETRQFVRALLVPRGENAQDPS